MREEYGGVENYIKIELELSDAEIATIRANLRAQ